VVGSVLDKFDIVIVGAGPAGTICALALRGSGLRVAMIDKGEFPRDKICGDSIPGPALKVLRKVLNGFTMEVELPDMMQRIRTSSINTTSGKAVQIIWKGIAFNCRRTIFDQFLLDLVKQHTNTHIYLGEKVDRVVFNNHVAVHLEKSDRYLKCDLVIGCDGANSVVSKNSGNPLTDLTESCIAMRAYFKGIDSPEDCNAFYLLKNVPGYFWMFPLGNGHFNVGIGFRTSNSRKKLNIKEEFKNAIEENPLIREKFRKAEKLSNSEAFSLPMGGYRGRISGEKYILAGDAARLIDPLQGHGIDKAMQSGFLAAQQAIRCFHHLDFSSKRISEYDQSIAKSIGKELRRNHRIMKLLAAQPWLINLIAVLTMNNSIKNSFLRRFYRSREFIQELPASQPVE